MLSRLGEQAESETYETIDYVGPTRRMIDLREKRSAEARSRAWPACACSSSTTTSASARA